MVKLAPADTFLLEGLGNVISCSRMVIYIRVQSVDIVDAVLAVDVLKPLNIAQGIQESPENSVSS